MHFYAATRCLKASSAKQICQLQVRVFNSIEPLCGTFSRICGYFDQRRDQIPDSLNGFQKTDVFFAAELLP